MTESAGAVRIVAAGIGTGGLSSLQALVREVQGPVQMAIVVASGSSADHLRRHLQPETLMKVEPLVDGTLPAADFVYLVPHDAELAIREGRLHLAPVDPVEGRLDRFYRTLANGIGRELVAVVLEGEGQDGAIGIKRVKELGGLTIAVDPVQAEHDEMPRAAITTGMIDLVVRSSEIARRVTQLGMAEDERAAEGQPEVAADVLRDLLALVRVRSGHDFGNYKRATLVRRVARRMLVCQAATPADYLRFVREQPTELASLLKDFLISVTSFFRDAAAYEALSAQIIPQMVAGRATDQPIRAWVAGCATGEEAYSLAILFAERLAQVDNPPVVQIFATDIDVQALGEARTGRYPRSIENDVSAERLDRFFSRDGETHYRIRKDIREMVLFSPHNLLRDPPFSRLDLASCRNVLIYLNRVAQERALTILHFGLRQGGHLWLSPSESADSAHGLFQTIDPKHRIFARAETPSAAVAVSSLLPLLQWQAVPAVAGAPVLPRSRSFGELHHRFVEHYAPPSVLLDEEFEILHMSEHVGRFLTLTGGEPTRSLLRLVAEALRLDVRAALYAARQTGGLSEPRVARVSLPTGPTVVTITARPIDVPDVARGMFIVMFDDRVVETLPASDAPERAPESIEPVMRELEDTLQQTREHLRRTVEQYETSVEELRASNEELQAMNEELRAATEELETSKEEVQSVNEELITLNHELSVKIEEVSRAHGDLSNLMSSTEIAVVFLDLGLRISRFTPRAQDIFNVIPSDVGRPLAHLTHRLMAEQLETWAQEVLSSHGTIEREVRATTGLRYLARAHPYRSANDHVEGVVLTFLDITRLKQAEASLRERDTLLRLGERAAGVGFWVLAPGGASVSMSDECWRLHGFPGHAQPISVEEWLAPLRPADRTRVAGLLASAGQGGDIEIELRLDREGTRPSWVWLLGRLTKSPGEDDRITGVIIDVTERRSAALDLRATEDRLHLALRTAGVFLLEADRTLRYGRQYGAQLELAAVGRTDADLFPADEAASFQALKERALSAGQGERAELALTMGGEQRFYDVHVEPIRSEGEEIVGVSCAGLDVTRRRRAELTLRDADRRKDEFLATLAHELRNPLAPIRTALEIQRLAPNDITRIAQAREKMSGQLTQVVQLVDDLLDIARITEGRIELRPRRVDLAEIVDAAIEATSDLFRRCEHTLTCHVPAIMPPVVADPTRLTQVITNLLQNAAKYTPQRGHVTLRVDFEQEPGSFVLSVEDDGVGLEAHVLSHVFDMFAQMHETLDRSNGGLGIGLTLVRQIVELHGGQVQARSEGKHKGTTVVVRLPVGVAPETVHSTLPPLALPAGPRRVVVVDDNPAITDLTVELLSLLGHEAHEAYDGAGGLALVRALQPDVVFLDIGLPDMDGTELARQIRADASLRQPLLVAVSGWGQPQDVARSREAGCDRHLVKPIDRAAIEAIVGRVVPAPRDSR